VSAVATMDWKPWVERWTTLVRFEQRREADTAAEYLHQLLDQGVAIPTGFFNLVLDVRSVLTTGNIRDYR